MLFILFDNIFNYLTIIIVIDKTTLIKLQDIFHNLNKMNIDLYEKLIYLLDIRLDNDNIKSQYDFYDCSKNLMIHFEGIRKKIYDDKTGKNTHLLLKGNPTIGIGFNLNVYRKYLDKILNKKGIAALILKGQYTLSDDEVNLLYTFSFRDHISLLKLHYGNHIFKLSAPTILVLFSLSFNCGKKLIGKSTMIYNIINQYFNKHFNCVVLYEKIIAILLKNSTYYSKNLRGLERRRIMEAAILASQI